MVEFLWQCYKVKYSFCKQELILFAALVFLFLKVDGQENSLATIVDCVTLTPIEDVIVLDSNGSIIGMSDSTGTVSIPDLSSQNVIFKKFGYETSYEKLAPDHYCMKMLSIELDEVQISDSRNNQDKLNEFVEKAFLNLLTSKLTGFYRFTYKTSYLKNNWNETINGVIKIELEPYSKKYSSMGGRIVFCDINLNVDSAVWYNIEIESPSLSTLLAVWRDPMRKSAYLKSRAYGNCDIRFIKEDSSLLFKLNSETKKIRSKGIVKFLPDSSIHSFSNQIEEFDKDYYSIKTDSIAYQTSNQQFFTYRFFKEIAHTGQVTVNSSIELKHLPKGSYNPSFCNNIPYGYIFDYRKSVEDSIIKVTLK